MRSSKHSGNMSRPDMHKYYVKGNVKSNRKHINYYRRWSNFRRRWKYWRNCSNFQEKEELKRTHAVHQDAVVTSLEQV